MNRIELYVEKGSTWNKLDFDDNLIINNNYYNLSDPWSIEFKWSFSSSLELTERNISLLGWDFKIGQKIEIRINVNETFFSNGYIIIQRKTKSNLQFNYIDISNIFLEQFNKDFINREIIIDTANLVGYQWNSEVLLPSLSIPTFMDILNKQEGSDFKIGLLDDGSKLDFCSIVKGNNNYPVDYPEWRNNILEPTNFYIGIKVSKVLSDLITSINEDNSILGVSSNWEFVSNSGDYFNDFINNTYVLLPSGGKVKGMDIWNQPAFLWCAYGQTSSFCTNPYDQFNVKGSWGQGQIYKNDTSSSNGYGQYLQVEYVNLSNDDKFFNMEVYSGGSPLLEMFIFDKEGNQIRYDLSSPPSPFESVYVPVGGKLQFIVSMNLWEIDGSDPFLILSTYNPWVELKVFEDLGIGEVISHFKYRYNLNPLKFIKLICEQTKSNFSVDKNLITFYSKDFSKFEKNIVESKYIETEVFDNFRFYKLNQKSTFTDGYITPPGETTESSFITYDNKTSKFTQFQIGTFSWGTETNYEPNFFDDTNNINIDYYLRLNNVATFSLVDIPILTLGRTLSWTLPNENVTDELGWVKANLNGSADAIDYIQYADGPAYYGWTTSNILRTERKVYLKRNEFYEDIPFKTPKNGSSFFDKPYSSFLFFDDLVWFNNRNNAYYDDYGFELPYRVTISNRGLYLSLSDTLPHGVAGVNVIQHIENSFKSIKNDLNLDNLSIVRHGITHIEFSATNDDFSSYYFSLEFLPVKDTTLYYNAKKFPYFFRGLYGENDNPRWDDLSYDRIVVFVEAKDIINSDGYPLRSTIVYGVIKGGDYPHYPIISRSGSLKEKLPPIERGGFYIYQNYKDIFDIKDLRNKQINNWTFYQLGSTQSYDDNFITPLVKRTIDTTPYFPFSAGTTPSLYIIDGWDTSPTSSRVLTELGVPLPSYIIDNKKEANNINQFLWVPELDFKLSSPELNITEPVFVENNNSHIIRGTTQSKIFINYKSDRSFLTPMIWQSVNINRIDDINKWNNDLYENLYDKDVDTWEIYLSFYDYERIKNGLWLIQLKGDDYYLINIEYNLKTSFAKIKVIKKLPTWSI